jgi:hypothetical protein
MTNQNDLWNCFECGQTQGRHDMWFDGDLCGKCNEKFIADLFETIETLPYKVQLILSEFAQDDNTYEACADLLRRCEAEGYTFEYGLDAIPFNLTKI